MNRRNRRTRAAHFSRSWASCEALESREMLSGEALTAKLVSPVAGATRTSDLGFVDVSWAADAGIDQSTIDVRDITIVNNGRTLTVSSATAQGGGVWRYRYSEALTTAANGSALPVQVTFVPGEVRDLAGNLNVLGASSFLFDNVAPRVLSYAMNADQVNSTPARPVTWASQRSQMASFTVTFSEPVRNITAADVKLANRGVNAVISYDTLIGLADSQFALNAAGTQLTISFPASGAGSLADGVYLLNLLPTVTDGANSLDGNSDGVGGDAYVINGNLSNKFFVLRGDWNGNGGVNLLDYGTFATHFSKQVGPTGAPAFVDLNRDGGVNLLDYGIFSRNYGVSIKPVNDAPYIIATPAVVELDNFTPSATIDLTSIFADVDDGFLTHRVVSHSSGFDLVDIAGNQLSMSGTDGRIGSGNVVIEAADAGNRTVQTTVHVNVNRPLEPIRFQSMPNLIVDEDSADFKIDLGKYFSLQRPGYAPLVFDVHVGDSTLLLGSISLNELRGRLLEDANGTTTVTVTPRTSKDGVPATGDAVTFTVTVNAVPDAPDISPQVFRVPEASAVGTVVGVVEASHPDAGRTLTFSIESGNDDGVFRIDSVSGTVSVAPGALLDFETRPFHSLQIRVTDDAPATMSSNATIAINVQNQLEANSSSFHAIVPLYQYPLSAPGTLNSWWQQVRGLATVDQPVSVVINPANGPINPAVGGADYNNYVIGLQLLRSNPHVRILGYVATGFGVTAPATVLQHVQWYADGYKHSVTGASLIDGIFLDEMSTSPDHVGAYAIIATGIRASIGLAGDFITGNPGTSSPTTYLDHQTADLFIVREETFANLSPSTLPVYIRDAKYKNLSFGAVAHATAGSQQLAEALRQMKLAGLDYGFVTDDSGANPYDATPSYFAEYLQHINAPYLADATFSLPENSANGTVVGTVAGFDPNVGQTLTYSITGGNPSTAFAINSASGQITVSNTTALSFETTPTFSLTVTATDNSTPTRSSSALVTVNLTNVNEAPVVMNPPGTITLNNGMPTITVDLNSKFADPEGGVLTFMIESVDDTIVTASLVDSALVVTGIDGLDGQTVLRVRATDPSGVSEGLDIALNIDRGLSGRVILELPEDAVTPLSELLPGVDLSTSSVTVIDDPLSLLEPAIQANTLHISAIGTDAYWDHVTLVITHQDSSQKHVTIPVAVNADRTILLREDDDGVSIDLDENGGGVTQPISYAVVENSLTDVANIASVGSTLSITPQLDHNGIGRIVLSKTSSSGTPLEDLSVLVYVQAVNDSPSAVNDVRIITTSLESSVSFSAEAVFSDPDLVLDYDELTYIVQSLNEGFDVSVENSLFTVKSTSDLTTSGSVILSAVDSSGRQAVASLSLHHSSIDIFSSATAGGRALLTNINSYDQTWGKFWISGLTQEASVIKTKQALSTDVNLFFAWDDSVSGAAFELSTTPAFNFEPQLIYQGHHQPLRELISNASNLNSIVDLAPSASYLQQQGVAAGGFSLQETSPYGVSEVRYNFDLDYQNAFMDFLVIPDANSDSTRIFNPLSGRSDYRGLWPVGTYTLNVNPSNYEYFTDGGITVNPLEYRTIHITDSLQRIPASEFVVDVHIETPDDRGETLVQRLARITGNTTDPDAPVFFPGDKILSMSGSFVVETTRPDLSANDLDFRFGNYRDAVNSQFTISNGNITPAQPATRTERGITIHRFLVDFEFADLQNVVVDAQNREIIAEFRPTIDGTPISLATNSQSLFLGAKGDPVALDKASIKETQVDASKHNGETSAEPKIFELTVTHQDGRTPEGNELLPYLAAYRDTANGLVPIPVTFSVLRETREINTPGYLKTTFVTSGISALKAGDIVFKVDISAWLAANPDIPLVEGKEPFAEQRYEIRRQQVQLNEQASLFDQAMVLLTDSNPANSYMSIIGTNEVVQTTLSLDGANSLSLESLRLRPKLKDPAVGLHFGGEVIKLLPLIDVEDVLVGTNDGGFRLSIPLDVPVFVNGDGGIEFSKDYFFNKGRKLANSSVAKTLRLPLAIDATTDGELEVELYGDLQVRFGDPGVNVLLVADRPRLLQGPTSPTVHGITNPQLQLQVGIDATLPLGPNSDDLSLRIQAIKYEGVDRYVLREMVVPVSDIPRLDSKLRDKHSTGIGQLIQIPIFDKEFRRALAASDTIGILLERGAEYVNSFIVAEQAELLYSVQFFDDHSKRQADRIEQVLLKNGVDIFAGLGYDTKQYVSFIPGGELAQELLVIRDQLENLENAVSGIEFGISLVKDPKIAVLGTVLLESIKGAMAGALEDQFLKEWIINSTIDLENLKRLEPGGSVNFISVPHKSGPQNQRVNSASTIEVINFDRSQILAHELLLGSDFSYSVWQGYKDDVLQHFAVLPQGKPVVFSGHGLQGLIAQFAAAEVAMAFPDRRSSISYVVTNSPHAAAYLPEELLNALVGVNGVAISSPRDLMSRFGGSVNGSTEFVLKATGNKNAWSDFSSELFAYPEEYLEASNTSKLLASDATIYPSELQALFNLPLIEAILGAQENSTKELNEYVASTFLRYTIAGDGGLNHTSDIQLIRTELRRLGVTNIKQSQLNAISASLRKEFNKIVSKQGLDKVKPGDYPEFDETLERLGLALKLKKVLRTIGGPKYNDIVSKNELKSAEFAEQLARMGISNSAIKSLLAGVEDDINVDDGGEFADNNAPEFVDFEVSTGRRMPIEINVLRNTVDNDGDDVFLSQVGTPSNGTISADMERGVVTYFPSDEFCGTDSFEVAIVDEYGATTRGRVTVSVWKDSLVGQSVSVKTPAGVSVLIRPQFDSLDQDGNPVRISGVTRAIFGNAEVVALQPDAVSYTPAPGFSGFDKFEYILTNDAGVSQAYEITVQVISTALPVINVADVRRRQVDLAWPAIGFIPLSQFFEVRQLSSGAWFKPTGGGVRIGRTYNTISGLETSKGYEGRFVALFDQGVRVEGPVFSFTTLGFMPPTSVQFSEQTRDSFRVSWTPPVGEDHDWYNVTASIDNGLTWVNTQTASGNSGNQLSKAATTVVLSKYQKANGEYASFKAGETYLIRVAAVYDNGNDRAFTNVNGDSVTTADYSVVQNVVPANPTETTVDLTWAFNDLIGDPGKFVIEMSTNGGSVWHEVPNPNTSAQLRAKPITGLEPGTVYRFRIKAVYPSGEETVSNSSSEISTLPLALRISSVRVDGKRTATVSWDVLAALPTTLQIEVRQLNSSGQPVGDWEVPTGGNIVADMTRTSKDISELLPGATYWVRVVTTNSSGARTESVPATMTLESYPAITGVSASDPTLSGIKIQWTRLETLDNDANVTRNVVDLYLNGNLLPNPPQTGSGSGPNHSLDITGLVKGTTYQYKVVAYNGTVKLSESALLEFSTLTDGLTIDEETPFSARANWTPFAGNGATDIRVKVLLAGTNTVVSQTTVPVGSGLRRHTVDGLSPDTNYEMIVEVLKGQTVISYSNREAFRTTSAGLIGVPTTDVRRFSIDVTWNDVSEWANWTKVQWREVGTTSWSGSGELAGTRTFYSITGLDLDTQYEIKVSANGHGIYDETIITRSTSNYVQPTTPTISNVRFTSMTVSWNHLDPSGAPEQFAVFRNGNFVANVSVNTSGQYSYADTGLSPGQSYTYYIRAKYATNPAIDGGTASGTTLAVSIPSTVSISQSGTGNNSFTFSWTHSVPASVAGLVTYRIERRAGTGSFGQWQAVNSTAIPASSGTSSQSWSRARSSLASPLNANTTYRFKIIAIYEGGLEIESDVVPILIK